MNLLIVDDEFIAIQGIMTAINWKALPYERVYTANSFCQAVDIFQQHPIHVMLCDIEMPQGNGLDLIEWVSAKYPAVVNIVLSCHNEFDFAKQAVRLQCMDYLLKPPSPEEITSILQTAADKAECNIRDTQYRQYGEEYIRNFTKDSMSQNDVVEESVQYIAAHIREELTVTELASLVYVSPDYLSRLFKRKYKHSVSEYIMDYRIRLAARLLQDTELSLMEIAEQVGINNYSYFIKLFKRKYKMTPKNFRSSYLSKKD